MQIKRGNSATLQFEVRDQDDVLVSDLATAIAVKFMLKKFATDTDLEAIVSKSLGDGVTVDDPSTGFISVALTSTDTDIDARKYYFALQVEYSATNKIEINIKEADCEINTIDVTQDIIE